MKEYITGLLYENGKPSLTRHVAVSFGVLLVAATVADAIMAVKGITWAGFDVIAPLSAAGAAGVQICNKYTDSRYNTPPGKFGEERK